MACRKRVGLAGGFVVEVRRARKQYSCFYCRRPILPSEHYVVIRAVGGNASRYHPQCFNTLIPHRLRVVHTAVGPCLESVLEDDSVL